MNDKRVEFNRDNKNVSANRNSKKKMDMNLDTSIIDFLKYQTVSVNYWGEGPSDDELVLSYDY